MINVCGIIFIKNQKKYVIIQCQINCVKMKFKKIIELTKNKKINKNPLNKYQIKVFLNKN